MRILSTTLLATALLLGSASNTLSRSDSREIERCDAGLNRNVSVCNNTLQIGSDRWETCLNTAIMMHGTCVADAVRRMRTLGEG